jgi:hypothetical protein
MTIVFLSIQLRASPPLRPTWIYCCQISLCSAMCQTVFLLALVHVSSLASSYAILDPSSTYLTFQHLKFIYYSSFACSYDATLSTLPSTDVRSPNPWTSYVVNNALKPCTFQLRCMGVAIQTPSELRQPLSPIWPSPAPANSRKRKHSDGAKTAVSRVQTSNENANSFLVGLAWLSISWGYWKNLELCIRLCKNCIDHWHDINFLLQISMITLDNASNCGSPWTSS